MRIKSPRTHGTTVTFTLTFCVLNPPPELRGCGYAFECDKDGNVFDPKHPSYLLCLSGKDRRLVGAQYRCVNDDYERVPGTGTWVEVELSHGLVEQHTHHHTTPAVGECNRCGRDVHLYGFTNTCECGADYNMSGQELAPREQWGEETGESLADILAADTDTYMDEECPPTVRSTPYPTLPPSKPVHVEVV